MYSFFSEPFDDENEVDPFQHLPDVTGFPEAEGMHGEFLEVMSE
jgi:hypothetical protein